MVQTTVDRKVFVVGGATNSASVAINQIYNRTTNKWTTGASMPTPRFSTASGVVDDILYVIGGSTNGVTPLSVVEAYDPSTNGWSTKASLPTATASPSAAVKTALSTSSAAMPTAKGLRPLKATIRPRILGPKRLRSRWPNHCRRRGCWDPLSWPPAGLPTQARARETTKVITLLAIPGAPSRPTQLLGKPAVRHPFRDGWSSLGGTNGTPLNVVESFSITANKWTTLAALPQAVVAPGGAEVNGLIYCFGGSNIGVLGQGKVYNYLQIYQP
jgi:hypothetical protein